MHKLIRYHLLLLTLVVSFTTYAQKKTYSPFSRYGIGELNTAGYGQNAGMANTGIGVRTNEHLNFMNPASYSAIDTMSFFFETGVTAHSQTFESAGGEEQYNNIDFSYFAMGFPISKNIHTSLGLRPYSNAGYEFEFSDGTSLNRAIGTGNLSAAYAGLSIRPAPSLSLGAHATYLFGNIRHTTFIEFIDDDAAYKYGVQNELHASDFIFDFGAQYTQQLSKTEKITAGITFRPQSPVNGDFQRTVAKGSQYAEDGKLFTANYVIPEASDTSNISSFDMASSIGLGISYQRNENLTIAADYVLSNWGDIKFPDGHTKTTNSSHFSAGAQFIPNLRSRNYLARMRYRAGFKYGNQYIQINDNELNNFGITFGIGLPHNRSKTSINLAFEYGTITPTGDLDINETYGKITLNITFHEFWFRQWKFD
jgi:hypothetical protein